MAWEKVVWLGWYLSDLPFDIQEALVQDPSNPAQARRELLKITDHLIANNRSVAAAFATRRARGVSGDAANAEIARAIIGCLSERWHGLPDRFDLVLDAVRRGRRAVDLFDDLCREAPNRFR